MMGIFARQVAAIAALLVANDAAMATNALDRKQDVLCSQKPPSEEIFRSEYCNALSDMREPIAPLADHSKSKEVYRLFWFRSFHPAIIIRIDISSDIRGSLTLHSLQTITALGDRRIETVNRPIDSTKDLSHEQIARFRKLIAAANFWKLPSQFHLDMGFGRFGTPIPKDQEVVVSDGAQWVIEGQDRTRYHLIGDEGSFPGPVWDIGLAMLHLAQQTNPSWLMGPVY